ncbi:diaminopimelate decarboxylase [Moraxella macacae 0408225]|uniref:Diaminopimelate decarboxylase n=1 Tax=Moraxella macacae 0408225 TaxID=1230338 RepID=L2F676_9GAMM|nr:diaminopimelate decarboxylase [Moraxella macacae]ELA08415.1 diaminopimelate decarboxylase [Moraxella macacae 0408225]
MTHDDTFTINPIQHVAHLPFLAYKNNRLTMDKVDLNTVANEFGTPVYVYSKQAILANYQAYVDGFSDIESQICYAVKANSNLAVLQTLAKAGAGFDLVTGGELARVLKAGGDPNKIVFSGLGKSHADIAQALQVGIACFNVESVSELYRISEVAQKMAKTAPISLRVNPDVDAKTHPYISTGLKDNKFGISHAEAIQVYKLAKTLPNLEIVGIDCHIGSQLSEVNPFIDALDKVIELICQLKTHDIYLKHIDLGGGLGVRYTDETPVNLTDFANALLPKLKTLGLKLYLEPGRSIVANAGVLLTKVDILKPTEHKNFAVVDCAMNDLIRPTLYEAVMAVIPVNLDTHADNKADNKIWDIVGAICETGDFLAKNRTLALAENDLLAITGAGAYSFSMSSNYNSRPRACETLIDNNKIHLIRERETVASLWEGEHLLG